jgi:hypothetical protein
MALTKANLANIVEDTLPVANGGTGVTTLASGRIPYGAGTSALASSSTFVFDGTNLGVGTATPTGKLDLATSGTFNSLQMTGSATTATLLQMTNTGGTFSIGRDDSTGSTFGSSSAYSGNLYMNNAYPMLFWTNGTERMRIDSGGNVGIATSGSVSKLEIYKAISTTGALTDTSLMLSTTATTGRKVSIGFGLGGGVANTCAANIGYDVTNGAGAGLGDIYFSTRSVTSDTAPTERMRITSSGNLLIGTTTESPGGRLTVITGSDEAVWSKNTAGASVATMLAWNNADSGNNYFHGFNVNTAGDAIGGIDYNRASNVVRYLTASDATLKNIIGDSNKQRSIEILNETKIREFAWKNDPTQKPQIGIIAQELHETFAGAVSVGGENDKGVYRPWAVDKTAFTFHLIAGWQAHEKLIKEQQALIENLTTRLTALEAK